MKAVEFIFLGVKEGNQFVSLARHGHECEDGRIMGAWSEEHGARSMSSSTTNDDKSMSTTMPSIVDLRDLDLDLS